MPEDPTLSTQLKEENLRYFSDQNPGFFRHKLSKKFTYSSTVGRRSSFAYYDLSGDRIVDKQVLKRINELAVPPAWKEVWVSPIGNSHLQATGIDSKGRKQYLYHPDWTKISQQNKFSKLVDFGLSLPKIRSRLLHDLAIEVLNKRKIIATIVWLLEHTFIRIGNDEYTKENNSYGLTTLKNTHAKVDGSEITFKFKGKSGVLSVIQVHHPGIAKTIRACIELPGFALFQYIDEDKNRHVVDSEEVNLFLKEVTKQDFSAKDFRTWGATDLCAVHFFEVGFPKTKKEIAANVNSAVKKVAHHLNNTVKICRNYYIHPTVISTYQQNILVPHFGKFQNIKSPKVGLNWDEYALIKLLEKHSLAS